MTKLQAPAHGLSLLFVTAEARSIDWREASGAGVEGYEIQCPRPHYSDVREHAPDLLDEWMAEAEEDGADFPGRDQPLESAHAEAFEQNEGFDQWRDGFEPMMNYAWPVSLAYGLHDLQAVVDLMAEHAGNCTLVQLSDDVKRVAFGDSSDAPDYAIALNGGGMDLSDHIVAAYLCCGCVPPIDLLERMSGVMSPGRRDRLGPVLLQAYSRAQEWLEARRDRLAREVENLFKA